MQTNVSKTTTLNSDVHRHTLVDSARCYQCGKCSAGCPLAEDMDYTSSTVMRMLQIEDKKTDQSLLRSQAIWLCVSCEMCITRCPMEIDIPQVMDYLRQRAITDGVQNPKANQNIIPFHKAFLEIIRYTGRLYEIGLVVDYKLRSWKFLQDLALAPKMLFRGKLPLFPETVKYRKQIKQLFDRTK